MTVNSKIVVLLGNVIEYHALLIARVETYDGSHNLGLLIKLQQHFPQNIVLR